MNKKTSSYIWFAAVMILFQAGLASLSFFVPAINSWLTTSVDTAELIVGYLTLETGIIAAGLAYLNFSESQKRRTFEKQLLQSVQIIPHARWLNVDEFYTIFLSELDSCKNHVNISYFGPVPPTQTASEHAQEYYDRAAATMRRRAREPVYYRRIVRLTRANWPWVKALCEQLRDVRGASIAVLEDSGEDLRNTLAISVQTVDGQRTYLTALTEREDFVPQRDLLVHSDKVCRGFEGYYNRLWSRATVVLAEGRINQQTVKEIEAELEPT